MVRSIEFMNFKAFKDSGKVDLKKINILVGPNSGGKSSFIKGILLLKNTMESKYKETAIDMNKEIGDYTSLVYNHDYNNKIGFKIEFNKDSLKKSLNTEYILFKMAYEIRNKAKEDVKDILDELIKKSESYSLNEISFFLNKNEKERIVVDKFKVKYEGDKELEIYWNGQDYCVNINDIIIKIPNLIVPDRFCFKINEEHLTEATIDELKNIAIVYVTFEIIKIKLKEFTENIIYISSFRNKPERVEYITKLSCFDTVGSRGENMISTLMSAENNTREKINFWLKEFDLAESIEVKSFGNGTYSLFIKDKSTGITNNLLDVGVGTSQLLPIIVESINSKDNSTIIIEEPEVHIHPGAQSKLGDLFVECCKEGNKQFIIETHSIFLVTQIEILVAQGKIDAKDVGVYYFRYGENGAIVKDMKLSSNGQFEESWPTGFFDVNYNLGKTLFEFM
ncbi:AAA family ATPase [Clostridium thermopalmarium]|uniref:Endonuclease GajA/Old nuclease/RecF-like AAA domain-containing protein n=1 Tax=Clostridium thermopalmarium DSM 5974 TaxID=1121340 RepID=A0A2T0AXT4_9CLOT|nr:DUF3696 domain-containing protein [Clostridium thermopalmarium]MBE6043449.1 DUF3696 domain-containing protein [Clostridium thermopalmarium]PRR75700.1 hypothetical protein CPAL_05310 [Clostridium thermopalmarium DSM 5974]PVZ26613.1 uncharacterized protein DUF3696 [Clostridium thermopalmarium DSM 5974]